MQQTERSHSEQYGSATLGNDDKYADAFDADATWRTPRLQDSKRFERTARALIVTTKEATDSSEAWWIRKNGGRT